jgi:hypothetical protein
MHISARTLRRTAIGACGPIALTIASIEPAQASTITTISGTDCTLSTGNPYTRVVGDAHKVAYTATVSCPAPQNVSVDGRIITYDTVTGGGDIGQVFTSTSSTGRATMTAYAVCLPGHIVNWQNDFSGIAYVNGKEKSVEDGSKGSIVCA